MGIRKALFKNAFPDVIRCSSTAAAKDRITKRGIQITVKTTSGKQIDLTVEPGDTIWRVKTLIQEKEGIPPDQQRLTFNNQELDEDKTLAEYNITKGSEINLTLRLVKNVSTGEELKAALTGTAVCTVKLTSDITVPI